jgi:hypothetical protein
MDGCFAAGSALGLTAGDGREGVDGIVRTGGRTVFMRSLTGIAGFGEGADAVVCMVWTGTGGVASGDDASLRFVVQKVAPTMPPNTINPADRIHHRRLERRWAAPVLAGAGQGADPSSTVADSCWAFLSASSMELNGLSSQVHCRSVLPAS